jgi:hypothetical protein
MDRERMTRRALRLLAIFATSLEVYAFLPTTQRAAVFRARPPARQ